MRVPLVLLLAVAALGSVAWGLLVPALQGPDESSHLAAVSRIADRGALLPRGDDEGLPRELLALASESGFGPLIGNLGARPYWTALDERRWRNAEARLGAGAAEPVAGAAETPPVQGANRNPPLYYGYLALPWRAASGAPAIDRIHLARLLNVPLLLATVALTWAIAAMLLPRAPWAPVLAAGMVALWPQLSFLSGTVNPDVLLVTLYTAFVALAVLILRDRVTAVRAAAIAAAALAAAATHARGVLLVPLAAVVLLLASPARRSLLAAAVVAGVVAAVAAGVLYVDATTAEGVSTPFSLSALGSYLWQFYFPPLPFMQTPLGGDYGFGDVWVRTYVGTFGSLEVLFPGWVYTVLQWVGLVVLAASVAALVRHRDAVRARWRAVLVLALLALTTVAALHAIAFRTLLIASDDPIIVGRHLLPLLSLVAVGFAVAAHVLPARLRRPFAALVLGALVLLQLGGLGLTLTRFYG